MRVRCHDELAVEPYSPSGESEGFRRLLSIDFVPRRPLREGFMIGLAGHGAGGSIELSIASVGSAARAGLLAVMVVLFGQGRGRGCPLLRSCCLTLSPSRQESFQGKRGSLPAEASFSGKSLFKGRGGASFVLDGPPSSNAGHFWLTSCRLRQLVEASANLPDGGDAAFVTAEGLPHFGMQECALQPSQVRVVGRWRQPHRGMSAPAHGRCLFSSLVCRTPFPDGSLGNTT